MPPLEQLRAQMEAETVDAAARKEVEHEMAVAKLGLMLQRMWRGRAGRRAFAKRLRDRAAKTKKGKGKDGGKDSKGGKLDLSPKVKSKGAAPAPAPAPAPAKGAPRGANPSGKKGKK